MNRNNVVEERPGLRPTGARVHYIKMLFFPCILRPEFFNRSINSRGFNFTIERPLGKLARIQSYNWETARQACEDSILQLGDSSTSSQGFNFTIGRSLDKLARIQSYNWEIARQACEDSILHFGDRSTSLRGFNTKIERLLDKLAKKEYMYENY